MNEAQLLECSLWNNSAGKLCREIVRSRMNAPTTTTTTTTTRKAMPTYRNQLGFLSGPTIVRPYTTLPLTPGTSPAPITPGGSGSLGGDPYGTLTNAGCNLITNSIARAACLAAASVLRPGSNNNNSGGSGGNAGGTLVPTTCPPGYAPDSNGVCRTTGMGRYLPGDVGTPDVVWTAVNGRYGAGLTPVAVQQVKRVCPTGYVLGKDGICYDHLRKGDRAHNPGTKPFLTGGEVAAIRKANRLRKKFNRLKGGRNALFPQARAAGPTKRRKK